MTKYFNINPAADGTDETDGTDGTDKTDETGETTITVTIDNLLKLRQDSSNEETEDEETGDEETGDEVTVLPVTLTEDSKIVITYSATLSEKAVIAGEGNPNTVKLTYSNNPNDTTSHGETLESKVVTYTTELTISKVDENNKVLTGAEFTLQGNGVNIVLVTTETFTEVDDGTYWKLKDGSYTTTAPTVNGEEDDNSADYDNITKKYAKSVELTAKEIGMSETSVVGTVDSETGKVTFTGLGAGKYTITESKTPAGYNTIDDIEFTIKFEMKTEEGAAAAVPTFSVENVSAGSTISVNSNKLSTTIVNKPGSLLPSTGGMGTTIFYVLGGILVIGAGVLLVVRRRMRTER